MTAFTTYSADMNRAPAPVTSIEEMSLNRLWAAPKLTRLSFNHLAVSGCSVAVPSDQLGRWRAGRQLDRAPCPLRWPSPWTLCARRAKISRAAHDGTHPPRAERA